MRMIFNTLISPLLNCTNHSKTCVWLSASSLKAFWSISYASLAVFRDGNKISSRFACSVQSDIMISWEELDRTWEYWQHKPVQPSTATSAWLLTREGCNYTHLVGEHSATIRKSSLKPVPFFFWVCLRRQVVKWESRKMKSTLCSEKVILGFGEIELWSVLWLIRYECACYWLQYICYGLCTYVCVKRLVLYYGQLQGKHNTSECREIIANNMEKCDEKTRQ